jgi:Zn-dependent protease with chaperone function
MPLPARSAWTSWADRDGMAQPLRGHWFDGTSSRPKEVELRLVPGERGPSLVLQPAGAPALTLANREVGWPETWSTGRAPPRVVVDLGPHGSLEITDAAGWQTEIARAGGRLPLAQRMQTRWPVLLAVALAALVGLFAFYRWGTPWAATQLTRQVPLEWETRLSDRFLQDLDGGLLKPSKLPAERQAELQARFEQLTRQVTPALRRYGGYAPVLRLHFRSGLGANAFALPGGVVVMTDAMVETAAKLKLSDDALVGVLAHEVGHVMHRHTTRIVVEQGVLNVGFGIAMGDVSSLVSFGGSLLTGLAYRRNHETEADCFAIALMRQVGAPTGPMADLLLAIDGGAGEPGEPSAKPPAGQQESAGAWNLLSSHPDTAERARDLKTGQTAECR